MLKIGITGGIGSGKTTVCKMFEILGIPVYYADTRAKALMTEDPNLVAQIKDLLGKKVYQKNGSLDRQRIAKIVFNDKEKLAKLNALVHPAVAVDGENWHQSQKDVPYTLKEAALLVESGSYKSMDYLISVWAPKELRIERVQIRDNSSRAEVEARIDKQMPEIEKLKAADLVIINDEKSSLIEQVVRIHHYLSN